MAKSGRNVNLLSSNDSNGTPLGQSFRLSTRQHEILSTSTNREELSESFVNKRAVGEWMSTKHRFKHERKILHISIIDYLQEWNVSKKVERFSKTVLLGKNPEMLSAIEPKLYA